MSERLHRALTTVSLLVIGVSSLAGCSASGSSAREIADRLAADLSGGDITSEAGTQGQQQLATILHGMDGMKPSVTVQAVRTEGDSGAATLHYSWHFPSGNWDYDTSVKLSKSRNKWSSSWTPAATHPQLKDGTRLVHQRLWPRRADITDPDGQPLMTYRPVVRVGVDKRGLSAAAATSSAAKLAALVKIDPKAYQAQVRAAGPEAFVEAITLRGNADDDGMPNVAQIAGAALLPDTTVLAPSRDFAAGILGTVGAASAEQVSASHGNVSAGDQVGQSGLESRYDQQLRGQPGDIVVLRSDTGSTSTQLFRKEPVAGKPLRTTLRLENQQLAQQVLSHTKPASALVAIDPVTGQVLAAATGAGNSLDSDATTGRYAPGSTFKTITALALLRSGMTPDSQVDCTSTVDVDGRRFKNYNDFPADHVGRMPLREAIALSCNTALIAEHGRIDASKLQQAAASLGLGQDYDAGLPMFLGSVPEPKNLPVGLAEAMIGQGTVEASPLAMATVAASIQAGHTVRPILLPDHQTTLPSAPPLTSQEAAQLRDMLHAVITSGSARFLTGIADGAKTGTAEYGTDVPPRTHAWMIAYNARNAVAVMVADGDSGSGTAGPLIAGYLQ